MLGSVIGFVLLGLGIAAFAKRDAIEAALQRFDRSNLQKRQRFADALRTPNAHMRLTIEEIAARTEPVETVWARDPATGTMVKRFLWRARTFDSEDGAKTARDQAILDEARGFYVDLDQHYRSLTGRRTR